MQETLSKAKKFILLIAVAGAIGAMTIAPDGAVENMLGRMASALVGSGNLQPVMPKPVPEIPRLASTKGKVVALNFWAMWCASCKIEKPTLERLQADYAEKGLEVITLSDAGDNLEQVKRYFAQKGYTHLKAELDKDGQAFHAFGLRGVPTTIIINREGLEVARATGMVDWDKKAARTLIEAVLGEGSGD